MRWQNRWRERVRDIFAVLALEAMDHHFVNWMGSKATTQMIPDRISNPWPYSSHGVWKASSLALAIMP